MEGHSEGRFKVREDTGRMGSGQENMRDPQLHTGRRWGKMGNTFKYTFSIVMVFMVRQRFIDDCIFSYNQTGHEFAIHEANSN